VHPLLPLLGDPLSTRTLNRRLYEQAVQIPGPATEALGAAAREATCYAVVGLNEREGGTAILGPSGKYLAGPVQDGETILCADLDFGAIADMKMIVDSAGHDARPDVVRLLLDRTPQAPLQATGIAP